jgi:hypothetical protein
LDRLVERDASGDEDCEHDSKSGELLATEGAQVEGDPERDGGERVAEVVDQVGEERDRVREDEDGDLSGGREAEDARLIATVRTPARERTIERSTRPWECPCSPWPWWCSCSFS